LLVSLVVLVIQYAILQVCVYSVLNFSYKNMHFAGECFTWGKNYLGQLGLGDDEERYYPTLVEALKEVRIVKAAGGGNHSAFVTDDGRVFTTGCGYFHATGHPTEQHLHVPKCVDALKAQKVVDITCTAIGCITSCVDGSCFSWGENEKGQCGSGAISKHVPQPQPVALPAGTEIAQVSSGKKWTLAVTRAGEIYMWGFDPIKEIVVSTPVVIPLPGPAAIVSTSHKHAIILMRDGSVIGWGVNTLGALGDGTKGTTIPPPGVKMHVAPEYKVTSVHTGALHSLVLTACGNVLVCGDDLFGDKIPGQPAPPMDTPVHTDQLEPIKLTFGPLGDGRIVAVACNTFHTLCVSAL